jgi:hypothetical protein
MENRAARTRNVKKDCSALTHGGGPTGGVPQRIKPGSRVTTAITTIIAAADAIATIAGLVGGVRIGREVILELAIDDETKERPDRLGKPVRSFSQPLRREP